MHTYPSNGAFAIGKETKADPLRLVKTRLDPFCTSPAPIPTKFTELLRLIDKRTHNLSFLCHDFAKLLPLKEKSKIENVTGNDPRSRLGQTHPRPLFRSNHNLPKVVGNAYFLPDKRIQSTFCRCNLLLSPSAIENDRAGYAFKTNAQRRPSNQAQCKCYCERIFD